MARYAVRNAPPSRATDKIQDPGLRRCYEFLETVSRSFTTVIQQLHDELRDPVSGCARCPSARPLSSGPALPCWLLLGQGGVVWCGGAWGRADSVYAALR